MRADYWIKAVVVFVGRGGEDRFDNLAGYVDRVVFLEVQSPRYIGEYIRGGIEPFICAIFLAVDLDCRTGCCRL